MNSLCIIGLLGSETTSCAWGLTQPIKIPPRRRLYLLRVSPRATLSRR
jgi:hypothetical protein